MSETFESKLKNPELTVGEMYEIHCRLYDDGMRLPLAHDSYLYALEIDEHGKLQTYKRITRYRDSLQEGGFSGYVWLCPDGKVLDRDIFSMEEADYLEYLNCSSRRLVGNNI